MLVVGLVDAGSDAGQGVDAAVAELRTLVAGHDHRAIKAAIERMNRGTEAFAARRMDRSVRQALTGRNIASV